MCATDEILQMNTLNGTNLVTLAATGALIVIDNCEIVFNLDCALGAGLFTLAAGYTTVKTNLAHLRALVVT